MNDAAVVLVTAPGMEKAAELARAVVEANLVACVNVVPAVRSIYRWEGKLCDDSEVLLVMKTTASAFEALRAQVVALHPYACPEVLMLPVAGGHAPYLDWINASVQPR